jgi:hypothetical protein
VHRQHLSSNRTDFNFHDDNRIGVSQNAAFESEEHDNVVTNTTPTDNIVPISTNSVADQVRISVQNAPKDNVVYTTTKARSDDYGSGYPNGDPGRFGSHPITQEDDKDDCCAPTA